MSSQSTLPLLLMLAACTVPPQQAQDEVAMSPVITVEDTPLKLEMSKEIRVPAIKPMHNLPLPAKSTADTRCPPIEGETEQQRIIRKLDCLLERD